jgi:hypothetical protein
MYGIELCHAIEESKDDIRGFNVVKKLVWRSNDANILYK